MDALSSRLADSAVRHRYDLRRFRNQGFRTRADQRGIEVARQLSIPNIFMGRCRASVMPSPSVSTGRVLRLSGRQ